METVLFACYRESCVLGTVTANSKINAGQTIQTLFLWESPASQEKDFPPAPCTGNHFCLEGRSPTNHRTQWSQRPAFLLVKEDALFLSLLALSHPGDSRQGCFHKKTLMLTSLLPSSALALLLSGQGLSPVSIFYGIVPWPPAWGCLGCRSFSKGLRGCVGHCPAG